MAMESKNSVSSIYDSSFSTDEDGISIIEKLSSSVDEQNIIINRIAVSQLINKLADIEKKVILLRYYKGRTQTETAKILGTSQVQVSRIEKRALEKMKRKLNDGLVTK